MGLPQLGISTSAVAGEAPHRQGQEPAVVPGDVEHFLSDNQKTLEELQTDVDLLVERRQLKAEHDKLESLLAEKARIEKQTATAAKALEKAERKTAPLYARLNEIKQALLREHELKNRLWDTCPYEELRNRLEEVLRRTNSMITQRAKGANKQLLR